MQELIDFDRDTWKELHRENVKLFTLLDNHVRRECFSDQELEALGNAMSGIRMSSVSALSGYTYLGQFLAHDLSRMRDGRHTLTVEPIPEDRLRSDVTPMLDLSSVYKGAVPNSHLRVADSACMALGPAVKACGALLHGYDVPRVNGVACLGDDRNDENLIVSQLHVQFLRLHNFFVEKILAEQPEKDTEAVFSAAKEQVILHYQEVILNDFLYEILHPSVWKSIIHDDRSVLWNPEPGDEAVLPVEFSAAAGRFGHAMVRDDYALNRVTNASLSELFTLTGNSRSEDNQFHLSDLHVIDWLHFFDFSAAEGVRGAYSRINFARRISPRVSVKLQHMGGLSIPEVKNLAARNLIRGTRMGLSTGQAVVRYLQDCFSEQLESCAIHIRLLTQDELNLNDSKLERNVLKKNCPQLIHRTPLWYYILAEARSEMPHVGFGKLGPLGSLIVAESVKGLLKIDSASILNAGIRREDITPTKTIDVVPGRRFLQMSDLILAGNPGLPDPTLLSPCIEQNCHPDEKEKCNVR